MCSCLISYATSIQFPASDRSVVITCVLHPISVLDRSCSLHDPSINVQAADRWMTSPCRDTEMRANGEARFVQHSRPSISTQLYREKIVLSVKKDRVLLCLKSCHVSPPKLGSIVITTEVPMNALSARARASKKDTARRGCLRSMGPNACGSSIPHSIRRMTVKCLCPQNLRLLCRDASLLTGLSKYRITLSCDDRMNLYQIECRRGAGVCGITWHPDREGGRGEEI